MSRVIVAILVLGVPLVSGYAVARAVGAGQDLQMLYSKNGGVWDGTTTDPTSVTVAAVYQASPLQLKSVKIYLAKNMSAEQVNQVLVYQWNETAPKEYKMIACQNSPEVFKLPDSTVEIIILDEEGKGGALRYEKRDLPKGIGIKKHSDEC